MEGIALRRATRWIVCAAGLMAWATVSRAQDAGPALSAHRARLLGVYDFATGDAIEGAEVTDLKSGTSALTTKTGTVSLIFLPEGGSLIRVRKVGYKPAAQFVSMSPDDTMPVMIMLTSTATVLPMVVTTDSSPHHVSPGLQAFEERRKAGFGRFITEAELRKRDNSAMPDVLRTLPGMQIQCSRALFPPECHAYTSRPSRLSGTPCKYTVYVDGIISGDDDLLKIPVNTIGAVESYSGPASIPPQYNMTAQTCGALLFWSRER